MRSSRTAVRMPWAAYRKLSTKRGFISVHLAVRNRARQAQLDERRLLLFAHTHGLQAACFVVVTQQVEHGMHRQERDLPLEGMAV